MPDRPEPLNNLGLVYEAVGKLDEAINSYYEAWSMSPTIPDYLGNLVRAKKGRGDEDDEVRLLLEELLLYEVRPGWRKWPSEQLALDTDARDAAASDQTQTSPADPNTESRDTDAVAPPLPPPSRNARVDAPGAKPRSRVPPAAAVGPRRAQRGAGAVGGVRPRAPRASHPLAWSWSEALSWAGTPTSGASNN